MEWKCIERCKGQVDLTKKRCTIFKSTRSIADEKQDVNIVFADINCKLKVVFEDGTSKFFKDISELNESVEQRMPYRFSNVLGLKRKVACVF